MSIILDDNIDWLFMFCTKCWDYQKFLFLHPLNSYQTNDIIGKCLKCNLETIVDLALVKQYYNDLTLERE